MLLLLVLALEDHLAAAVGVFNIVESPVRTIETNVRGTELVLEIAAKKRKRVLIASTSEVYGPECDPMDECLSNPRPNNRYGLSKLLGEQLVEYEVRTHGLHAAVVRPFMVYDENEDFGDHRSAMIRFTSDLALGRPIDVHRGSARSWLHISDAVRAIEAAASLEDYAVINIGHPDVVPMVELAEMIRRNVGAAPELVHIKELPGRMTLVKRPTLDRMRNLLGVAPRVSLEEGVRRVCGRVKARLNAGDRPISRLDEA